MRRALVLIPLLVAACGEKGGQNDRTRQELSAATCGTQTCSALEYCHVQCTCCGIPTGGDSGLVPSAIEECRPIPAGCLVTGLCGCGLGPGVCDAAKRLVEEPCG